MNAALQRPNVVTAYVSSKQLLPFGVGEFKEGVQECLDAHGCNENPSDELRCYIHTHSHMPIYNNPYTHTHTDADTFVYMNYCNMLNFYNYMVLLSEMRTCFLC